MPTTNLTTLRLCIKNTIVSTLFSHHKYCVEAQLYVEELLMFLGNRNAKNV